MRARLAPLVVCVLALSCAGAEQSSPPGRLELPIIECNATTIGQPCDSDDTLCTRERCIQQGPNVVCQKQNDESNGTSCESDGDPCTADTCLSGACVHGGLPDGTACNDGQFCSSGEMCLG